MKKLLIFVLGAVAGCAATLTALDHSDEILDFIEKKTETTEKPEREEEPTSK